MKKSDGMKNLIFLLFIYFVVSGCAPDNKENYTLDYEKIISMQNADSFYTFSIEKLDPKHINPQMMMMYSMNTEFLVREYARHASILSISDNVYCDMLLNMWAVKDTYDHIMWPDEEEELVNMYYSQGMNSLNEAIISRRINCDAYVEKKGKIRSSFEAYKSEWGR